VTNQPVPQDVNTALDRLREKIDQVDDRILALLNTRAELAQEVGKTKEKSNLSSFYSPERERRVLDRLVGKNSGPFPDDAVRLVWREIMSASLSLERPLQVAFLGPTATFTEMAAIRAFGSSAALNPVGSIPEVFRVVERGEAQYGEVPIENSTEGVVTYTLDVLIASELKIASEVMIEVNHHLLNQTGRLEDITQIYSHPQATAQCRRWLDEHAQGIPVKVAASTARAAEIAAGDPDSAAIAGEPAARVYGLRIVKRKIQDLLDNVTRFLVVGRDTSAPTGHDKTSLLLSVKNRPGALFGVLQPFANHKINLTKIQSRPSKRKAWEYIFFIDFSGHADDENVKNALEELREWSLFVKVLGSYPSAEEIQPQ